MTDAVLVCQDDSRGVAAVFEKSLSGNMEALSEFEKFKGLQTKETVEMRAEMVMLCSSLVSLPASLSSRSMAKLRYTHSRGRRAECPPVGRY